MNTNNLSYLPTEGLYGCRLDDNNNVPDNHTYGPNYGPTWSQARDFFVLQALGQRYLLRDTTPEHSDQNKFQKDHFSNRSYGESNPGPPHLPLTVLTMCRNLNKSIWLFQLLS